MPLLTGLPDTTDDKEADLIYSASAALKALRSGRAATAAGDNGAVNVWIDDKGHYRCELMRRMSILRSESPRTLRAVGALVKQWLFDIR